MEKKKLLEYYCFSVFISVQSADMATCWHLYCFYLDPPVYPSTSCWHGYLLTSVLFLCQNSGSPSLSQYKLLTARNIQRPQVKFRDKIDNENRPFVPRITEKPNALKSLEGRKYAGCKYSWSLRWKFSQSLSECLI